MDRVGELVDKLGELGEAMGKPATAVDKLRELGEAIEKLATIGNSAGSWRLWSIN